MITTKRKHSLSIGHLRKIVEDQLKDLGYSGISAFEVKIEDNKVTEIEIVTENVDNKVLSKN